MLIAELIAGASAVVGVSLHLAITALSFGVPLFRPGDAFVGKFAILPQHASVHTFSMDGEIDPDWFVRTLDQSEQTSELPGILRALDTHWDKVAACVSASPRNQNAEDIFGKFLPRLPALLEAEAERDGMRELLRAQYRTVSMRDRRVASTYGTGGNKTPVDLEGEDMLNIDAAPDGRAVLPGEPAMEAAIIAERDRQISLRDRKIQELTAAIEERDRRIAALTNAANQLNGLIQSRNEEVRALRQSTSWTITAPLRHLSATMRGGDAESNIIRFEKLEQQKLNTEPYDWAFANDVFAPRDARSLVDTYPRDHFKTVKGYDGEKGYEYEARALIHMGSSSISYADELSGAWRRLVNDLLSADYRAAMTRLIARDLMSAPMEAYVCHFGPGAWLGPHLDLKDKIMTHVFYFNEAWDPRDGGCLNILRSRSMSDSIAEVPPVVGNTSVLLRSNNSWHSVSRVAEGCQTSRRSMNVIFYHPGAVSTMWPPGDSTPLHRYDPPEG